MKRGWRAAGFLLQAAVTVGLLAWFFRDSTFRSDLAEVLRRADGAWLAAGLGIAGIESLLGAVRWFLFLRILAIRLPFGRALQIQFLGLLFNTIMVGAVGGDVIKAACLVRDGHRKTRALLSVLLDRMSGLAALVIATVCIAVPQYGWLTRAPLIAKLIQAVLIYLAVVTILLSLTFLMCGFGHSDRIPRWAPFRAATIDLVRSYSLFIVRWRTTIIAALLSLVMLFCYFGVYLCAARAFGVEAPALRWFALMPIVEVITALPVSFGGIGVREHVFTAVLGQQFAVPTATAVLVSMTGFLLGAVWGLAGAALLPFFRGVRAGIDEREGEDVAA